MGMQLGLYPVHCPADVSHSGTKSTDSETHDMPESLVAILPHRQSSEAVQGQGRKKRRDPDEKTERETQERLQRLKAASLFKDSHGSDEVIN